MRTCNSDMHGYGWVYGRLYCPICNFLDSLTYFVKYYLGPIKFGLSPFSSLP